MYELTLIWFFVLGAIIGSFLNVVIYRLNTGKSLSGHSHCLSCAANLRAIDLVPLLSFVALRGRCRQCGASITARYFFVELITACLFLWTAVVFLSTPVLLAFTLMLCALLVVVLVYDIRHMIIPDQLVGYLLAVAVAYVLWDPVAQMVVLPGVFDILGAVVPALFFASLWGISRGRWIGLGDAKLVVPLGLVVGFADSVSLVVFAFWIGAGISVLRLITQKVLRSIRVRAFLRGKLRLPFLSGGLTMSSEVPFAPFLILAFFLVHLGGAEVFDVIDPLIGLFQ